MEGNSRVEAQDHARQKTAGIIPYQLCRYILYVYKIGLKVDYTYISHRIIAVRLLDIDKKMHFSIFNV